MVADFLIIHICTLQLFSFHYFYRTHLGNFLSAHSLQRKLSNFLLFKSYLISLLPICLHLHDDLLNKWRKKKKKKGIVMNKIKKSNIFGGNLTRQSNFWKSQITANKIGNLPIPQPKS